MIFGHRKQWSDGWENGFKTTKKQQKTNVFSINIHLKSVS